MIDPDRWRDDPSARRDGRRRLGTAVVLAVLVGVLAAACTAADPERGTPAAEPSGGATAAPSGLAEPTELATGLRAPWSVAFVDARTALVSERDTGTILQLAPGGAPRRVGTVPDVEHTGEGGLLGLAVREDRLYAYLTTAEDNRVVRFPLIRRSGTIDLGDGEAVLSGLPSASIHNGGRIAFGPDGRLYVTVGDAANPPDAQDRESLGGKILRVEPDGAVPDDNPFPGSPVYSLGHRNPQGLAWDEDGTLYAAEFGQNTWDELNVIRAGRNYGWPEVEGVAKDDRYEDPVQQWAPSEASPSGIAIRGDAIHIANLRGERLRVVPLGDLSSSTSAYAGRYGRLRDVVTAPDGSLWVLTSNTDGRGRPNGGDDRALRIAPPG